jgi:formamidopyrimidine-DNA glycosylase
MPELPDIAAYISALEARVLGQVLERARLGSAFLLRTVEPLLGHPKFHLSRVCEDGGRLTWRLGESA